MPEATALDLLRHLEGAGHLDNVATVLAELAEKTDAKGPAHVAGTEGELATSQRLGHLLDEMGACETASPWRPGSGSVGPDSCLSGPIAR